MLIRSNSRYCARNPIEVNSPGGLDLIADQLIMVIFREGEQVLLEQLQVISPEAA